MKKLLVLLATSGVLTANVFAEAAPRTVMLPSGKCYVMYDTDFDDNMYDTYKYCTTGCNSVSISGCGDLESIVRGTPFEEPE